MVSSEVEGADEEDLIIQRQADVALDCAGDLQTRPESNLNERKAHYSIFKAFTQKQSISRSDRASLKNYVEAYNNLKMYDAAMGVAHLQFILLCGNSDKQLEDKNHNWAPSKVDKLFELLERVLKASKAKFVSILNDKEYEEESVLLKQYATSPVEDGEISAGSSSSKSNMIEVSMCKADKSKKFIEFSYAVLKAELDREEAEWSWSSSVMLEKFQYLEKHIADFIGKLDEYAFLAKISNSDYETWHQWHVD